MVVGWGGVVGAAWCRGVVGQVARGCGEGHPLKNRPTPILTTPDKNEATPVMHVPHKKIMGGGAALAP